MGKQSGLGDNLYVAGYDLSGDIGAVDTISGGPAVLDVTSIDKSAMQRIGGVRSGGIDYTAFYDTQTDQAHARLKLLPTTDQILTYCRGTTLGGPAACIVAKQLNYDPTRSPDGSFTFKVSSQSNGYGLEWGTQLTPGKRTDATATNGTGVDLGATWSHSFGLQAYIHVFALASGTPTVKIQSSSDDAATDAYADVAGATFGVVTANTAARVATASDLAIERYLRVVTTGIFSTLTFSVVVTANETAVTF